MIGMLGALNSSIGIGVAVSVTLSTVSSVLRESPLEVGPGPYVGVGTVDVARGEGVGVIVGADVGAAVGVRVGVGSLA